MVRKTSKIQFGPENDIFFKQLEADVKLLQKVNVMDYSLLLGIHDVKREILLILKTIISFEPKSLINVPL